MIKTMMIGGRIPRGGSSKKSHWQSARCGIAAAVLAVTASTVHSAFAAGTSYTYMNLGSVPNDVSGGQGINNNTSAEVVGSLGDLPAYSTGGATFTSFGSVSNPPTTAFAVNDGGIIVGGVTFNGTDSAAFYTTTTSHTPINLPTSFGTSDAGASVGSDAALAVNGNGTVYTVVGRSSIADGASRAFSWTPGATTLTALGPGNDTGLGGTGEAANSTATGINSAGNIVGQATITGDNNSHAFFYSGGKMYDLGTQSGSGDSIADAINTSGTIVGQTDVGGNAEAFIYNGYQGHLPTNTSGTDTQIADPGNLYWTVLDLGGDQGEALAINSSGTVVGDSDTSDGNEDAFVYSGGTLSDLNDDVTGLPEGVTLQSATGINNAGQITGVAVDDSGDEYAFLLTVSPSVPEPTSAGLLLTGFAMLSTRRRRKM